MSDLQTTNLEKHSATLRDLYKEMAETQEAADLNAALPVLSEAESRYAAAQWTMIWRRFRRNRAAIVGGIVVLIFYVVALFGDFIAPYALSTRFVQQAYLPPQPITVTVDSRLVPRDYNPQPQAIARAADKPVDLAKFRPILSALVPPMKKAAEERAKTNAQSLIAAALQALESGLGAEFERLKALQHINPGIRESEVEALCYHLESLRAALPEARVRLDAIRLAVSPDFMRLVPA